MKTVIKSCSPQPRIVSLQIVNHNIAIVKSSCNHVGMLQEIFSSNLATKVFDRFYNLSNLWMKVDAHNSRLSPAQIFRIGGILEREYADHSTGWLFADGI